MKKLLTVTGLSAVVTLLRMLSGFIVAKLIAIYAGPSGLAVLGQFQSFVSAVYGVANAPVGNGVVRYTAENWNADPNQVLPWWRASLHLVLSICCVIIPLGCLASGYISG